MSMELCLLHLRSLHNLSYPITVVGTVVVYPGTVVAVVAVVGMVAVEEVIYHQPIHLTTMVKELSNLAERMDLH